MAPMIDFEQKLEEAVNRLVDKTKDITEAVKTAEAGEREKLQEDLADVKKQLEGINGVLEKERRRPDLGNIEIAKKGEKDAFSFGRMCHLVTGHAKIEDDGYEYERDVFLEGQKEFEEYGAPHLKASFNASTDASGGFFVPTSLMAGIIPELEAMEIAAALGATIINGASGNIEWLVDQGGIAASYIDTEKQQSGTDTAGTVSQINLKPHVCAAFVPLSWSMQNQPAIALDQWVQERIAKKLALREDLSFFLGTGSSSEPRGVMNHPDVPTITWSATTAAQLGQGASPAQEIDIDLLKFYSGLLADDAITMASRGNLAWALDSYMAMTIAAAKDSDRRPIFRESNGSPITNLLGHPVQVSTQLNPSSDATAHKAAFGDWSQTMIARWGTMQFAASNQAGSNFHNLTTTIRGVTAHDTAVLQPKALRVATDIDLTNSAFNGA